MITQKFTLTLPEEDKRKVTFGLPVFNSPNKFSAKLTISIDKNEKKSWEIVSKKRALSKKGH